MLPLVQGLTRANSSLHFLLEFSKENSLEPSKVKKRPSVSVTKVKKSKLTRRKVQSKKIEATPLDSDDEKMLAPDKPERNFKPQIPARVAMNRFDDVFKERHHKSLIQSRAKSLTSLKNESKLSTLCFVLLWQLC